MAEQQKVLQLSAAMDDTPAPIYQRVKLAIIREFPQKASSSQNWGLAV
jgi:hypothetical protein